MAVYNMLRKVRLDSRGNSLSQIIALKFNVY